MAATDMNKQVHLEGAGDMQLSLADLANIDMTEIKEKRGAGPFPRGRYEFEVEEAKLDTFEKDIEGRKVNVPCAKFTLVPKKIIACLEQDLDNPEGHKVILERKYAFMIGFTDASDLGRVKAFMMDGGYKGAGKMQELLDGFKKHHFIGVIVHRRNKNDPDNPYVNLDMSKGKIEPVQATA